MTEVIFETRIPAEHSELMERLRELILLNIPDCQERLAYGVPHFYLRSRVCFIWPTTVKGSGVEENGVLFGFWKGHLIKHKQEELRGQENKIVRFNVYQDIEQINEGDIRVWLQEANLLDQLKPLKTAN
jgi:hypothetical protein